MTRARRCATLSRFPGSSMAITEPLLFSPVLFEKVWGGRVLEDFLGRPLEQDGPIGEIWTLVDRDDASSQVQAGELAGRSLRGLMMSEREALLGATTPTSAGYFPLLVKYLDARANLSVQVHPDARAAQRLGGDAASKSECWYVLSADPGARVYVGFKPELAESELCDKLTGENVADLLDSYEVRVGDFVYVPAGTVHAIGAGITPGRDSAELGHDLPLVRLGARGTRRQAA